MQMLDLLQGSGVAIQLEQGAEIGYSELRKRIHDRAQRWLDTLSIASPIHETVVIVEQTPFEQIVSTFACFQLGMVVNIDGDPTSIHANWICLHGTLQKTNLPTRVYGEEVDALFVTSGTTAPERIVGHRQESLLICAREMAETLALGTGSRVALTLDLSFHYGFSVMTSTFFANGTLLLSSTLPSNPRFVFQLNAWFQSVRPTVLASVPQGWALFLRMLSEDVWAELVTMVTAGDLMPENVVHSMSSKQPVAQIHILYGSTEVLRSCHRLWSPLDKQGCIGIPFPSAVLNITDGVVYQRGETLLEELWEENRCTRRPVAYRLQDTLYVDETGLWYFLHRSTDVLKVSGKRISPLVVEHSLLTADAIADAIVVEHEGNIMAVLCVPITQNLTTIEVEIPKAYQPKRWIVLREAFPLTQRNKRSRQWIKSYALRHFEPTATPPFRLVAR